MAALNKLDPPVVEPDQVEPQPRYSPEEAPIITGDTARQGPDGHRVLYVLLAGLAGAAILMLIIYAFLPTS